MGVLVSSGLSCKELCRERGELVEICLEFCFFLFPGGVCWLHVGR